MYKYHTDSSDVIILLRPFQAPHPAESKEWTPSRAQRTWVFTPSAPWVRSYSVCPGGRGGSGVERRTSRDHVPLGKRGGRKTGKSHTRYAVCVGGAEQCG